MTERFYSHGKLLISGEYLVLDGALSLAVPTSYGQSLFVETIEDRKLIWTSLDENGHPWFEETFLMAQMASPLAPKDAMTQRLVQIIQAAKQLNPHFLNTNHGYKITTSLTFKRHWGLGTSSTLINNVAHWAEVDAYRLLEKTFGGSGYDIACAQHPYPITYQLQEGQPSVEIAAFNPFFKDQLYFVYLNKKQDSREGISTYKENRKPKTADIIQMNEITKQMISCQSLEAFEGLMLQHEHIISSLIQQPPIQASLFNDFNGQIKSLGAWGGDFVMASSKTNPTAYFKGKGFDTVIPYDTMVLKNTI